MGYSRLLLLAVLLLALASPVQATTIITATNVEYINITYFDVILVEDSNNVTFDGVTFFNTTVLNSSSSNITIRNTIINASTFTVDASNTLITGSTFDPRGLLTALVINRSDVDLCDGTTGNTWLQSGVNFDTASIDFQTSYTMDSNCEQVFEDGTKITAANSFFDCSLAFINQSEGLTLASDPNNETAISIQGDNITVANCNVTGFYHGIGIDNGNGATVVNNTVFAGNTSQTVGRALANFVEGAFKGHIISNNLFSNDFANVMTFQSNDSLFTGNTFLSVEGNCALCVTGNKNTTVVGNVIEGLFVGNGGSDFLIRDNNITNFVELFGGGSNAQFQNNIIEDDQGADLRISDFSNITVINNTIIGLTTTVAGASNLTFLDNIFNKSVTLEGGSDAQLQNNTFLEKDPDSASLFINGFENVDLCDASGNTNTMFHLSIDEATLNLESQCNYTIPLGIALSGGSTTFNNSALDCAGASIFGNKSDAFGAVSTAINTVNGAFTEGNFTVTNCNFFNYTKGVQFRGEDVTITNVSVSYENNSVINILGGSIINLDLHSEDKGGILFGQTNFSNEQVGGNYDWQASTFNDTIQFQNGTNITFNNSEILTNLTIDSIVLNLSFTSNTWKPANITETIFITVSGLNNTWNGNIFQNISFTESGSDNICTNGTYRDITYSGGAGCAPPNITVVRTANQPIDPNVFFHDQPVTIEIGCIDQTSIGSGRYSGTGAETFNVTATVFNSTALRGQKAPDHVAGTYTVTEVSCTDAGSGGNTVFISSSTGFQVNNRPPSSTSPAPPPPPPPPPAIGGGGGGGCPPFEISTPAGCLPGCPAEFVYDEEEEVCIPLEEFLSRLNITLVNVSLRTFPSRVNKLFLPVKYITEKNATYIHKLIANKKLANCSTEDGEFTCEVVGDNSMLISRLYVDMNLFGEEITDTIIVESEDGEIISVPYTVTAYNPGFSFFHPKEIEDIPEAKFTSGLTGFVIQGAFKERGGSVLGVRLTFVLLLILLVYLRFKRKQVIAIIRGVFKQ